jgi:hypothetical protein
MRPYVVPAILLLVLIFGCSGEQPSSPGSVESRSVSSPICGDKVCDPGEQCDSDCKHEDSCSDSDGGIVDSVKGSLSVYSNNVLSSYSDACINSSLLEEFYCAQNLAVSQNLTCAVKETASDYCNSTALFRRTLRTGCFDGACRESQEMRILKICEVTCDFGRCVSANEAEVLEDAPVVTSDTDTCADSDNGATINVKGTVLGIYNNSPYRYSDFCRENTLVEYVCRGKTFSRQELSCPADAYSEPYCLGSNVYRNYVDHSCAQGACMNVTAPKLAGVCTNGCAGGVCK